MRREGELNRQLGPTDPPRATLQDVMHIQTTVNSMSVKHEANGLHHNDITEANVVGGH